MGTQMETKESLFHTETPVGDIRNLRPKYKIGIQIIYELKISIDSLQTAAYLEYISHHTNHTLVLSL